MMVMNMHVFLRPNIKANEKTQQKQRAHLGEIPIILPITRNRQAYN